MVDFPDDVLNTMTIGDRMQIRAYGVGLNSSITRMCG